MSHMNKRRSPHQMSRRYNQLISHSCVLPAPLSAFSHIPRKKYKMYLFLPATLLKCSHQFLSSKMHLYQFPLTKPGNLFFCLNAFWNFKRLFFCLFLSICFISKFGKICFINNHIVAGKGNPLRHLTHCLFFSYRAK